MNQNEAKEKIKQLLDLQKELMNTINNVNDNNDLNRVLIDLVGKAPEHSEIYQTMLLITSKLETDYKLFKRNAVEVIDHIIHQKIEHIKLTHNISERVTILENINNSKGVQIKVPYLGLITIKEFIYLATLLIFAILILTAINPILADKIINFIMNMIPFMKGAGGV